MPTTNNEASVISNIILDFLPANKAEELVKRLLNEVGYKTDNYSLRGSIFMLCSQFFDFVPDEDFIRKLSRDFDKYVYVTEQSPFDYSAELALKRIEYLGLTLDQYYSIFRIKDDN